jgi:uncharacterized cupin superfamily protein
MVPEAPLERTEHGLVPSGPGWFVLGAEDTVWTRDETFGDGCLFEPETAPFEQIGYDLRVLRPGQPNGLYHREQDQEDFLVLSGECLLLVEGEERRLRAWDFVHCPPGTEHIFVGAGDGPCVIFMIGGRANRGIVYPRSELALRHGAGVDAETSSPREAYRAYPPPRLGPSPGLG